MPPVVAQNTTFFKAGWSDLERQVAAMDAAGVEQAVLLYPTSDAHIAMGGWGKLCRIYNEEIVGVIRKYPNRFIGGGILPVDSPEDIGEELLRVRDFGFKLISMASSYDGRYLDEEKFFPVFEFAALNKMPIHVHPQIISPIGEERVWDPLLSPVLEYVFDVSMCIGKLMMSEVFLRFPDVNFIFAHYGGVLPLVKERFDTTYNMLRRRELVKDLRMPPGEYFKNLYFDTSGSKSRASLLAALEVASPEHILFASDFPANQNLAEAMAVIRDSALDRRAQDGILGGNLAALLGR